MVSRDGCKGSFYFLKKIGCLSRINIDVVTSVASIIVKNSVDPDQTAPRSRLVWCTLFVCMPKLAIDANIYMQQTTSADNISTSKDPGLNRQIALPKRQPNPGLLQINR